MSGLTERLRYTHEHGIFDAQIAGMLASPEEAADRIEKLEAALREIADHSPGVTHGWAEHVRHIARTALSP